MDDLAEASHRSYLGSSAGRLVYGVHWEIESGSKWFLHVSSGNWFSVVQVKIFPHDSVKILEATFLVQRTF